jgi:HK97 gp10 family phage protein
MPDQALKQVAMEVVADAQMYAPYDTGALKNSIAAGPLQRVGSRSEIDIGSDLFYAPFQEFGTRHIRPKAFLGRAIANARARHG